VSKQTSSRTWSGQQPAPVQPVVQPPKDTVLAAFTLRELDTIRSVCRDSDNENAIRFLQTALDRTSAK
jgi:hypothetical protein